MRRPHHREGAGGEQLLPRCGGGRCGRSASIPVSPRLMSVKRWKVLLQDGRPGLKTCTPIGRSPGDHPAHLDPSSVDKRHEDRSEIRGRPRPQRLIQVTPDARKDVDLGRIDHEGAFFGRQLVCCGTAHPEIFAGRSTPGPGQGARPARARTRGKSRGNTRLRCHDGFQDRELPGLGSNLRPT